MNIGGAAAAGGGSGGMNGLSGGAKAGGAKGAGAKGGGQAGQVAQAQKPQNKQPADQMGRDGALSKGQGYSQRDAFEPAKQAQQPQQAQKNNQPKIDPQEMGRKESQQQRQIRDAMFQIQMAMQSATSLDKDELLKMLEAFKKWLKEMDAIFLQPTPG